LDARREHYTHADNTPVLGNLLPPTSAGALLAYRRPAHPHISRVGRAARHFSKRFWRLPLAND